MSSVPENAYSNGDAILSNNNAFIFSLSFSPDFGLMQKIASAIPKKTGTPLQSMESAIEMSGLENETKYVFKLKFTPVISACCQFYIGRTLVATGREVNKKGAKEKAMQYGIEILTNLSNLPRKTLEDVKQELENWKKTNWNSSIPWSEISSSDLGLKSKMLRSQLPEMEKKPAYADLHLILGIAEKLIDDKNSKNINKLAVQKIREAASKLKCASEVHFFHFSEDNDTHLGRRIFHCDFVIKNIFICQSKASSKKKAKIDASEKGFHFLTNFIENCELRKHQNVQEQVQSVEINFESLKKDNSVDDKIPETEIKTSVPTNGCDSQSSFGSKCKFRINHRLLKNSRNRQTIIFDYREISHQNVANSLIYVTDKSKNYLKYEIDEIPMDASRNSKKMFRCVITLNKEEIGKAQGFTEEEAKSNADEDALKFLQQIFYTIKFKDEVEESFFINRSYVLKGRQDLDFSRERSFIQRVKALLKDYIRSNTTNDLIFSTEFNEGERKKICQLAERYNLLSFTRGKDQQSLLFITRKISHMELLEYLIEAGGSINKYELEDRSV